MDAMKGQVSSSYPPNTIISINYHINITSYYPPHPIIAPSTTSATHFSFSALVSGMIGYAYHDNGSTD